MALLRRFGWFLVGVTIGTILVVFFFGDRDIQCSYFPNDRLLADLRKKEVVFSGEVRCQNECAGVDTGFYNVVFRNADVDFGYNQRGTDHECNEYKLDYEDERGGHIFFVENCQDSTVRVVHWEMPANIPCDCPSTLPAE